MCGNVQKFPLTASDYTMKNQKQKNIKKVQKFKKCQK